MRYLMMAFVAATLMGMASTEGAQVETPVVVEGTQSNLGRADMSASGSLMCSAVPTQHTPGEVSSLVDSIELASWDGRGWTSLGLIFEWDEPWKYETCSILDGEEWLAAAFRIEWQEPANYGVTVVRDGHVYVSGGNIEAGSTIVMRDEGGPERIYPASYWGGLASPPLPSHVWAEPGLLRWGGFVWMTLTRFPGGDLHLFRSSDGVDWSWRGLLLPATPEGRHGASNLFKHGGKVWMNTTPRGNGLADEDIWVWRVDLSRVSATKSHEREFSDPGVRGTAGWHFKNGYLVHRIVPPAEEPIRAYSDGSRRP